MSPNVISRSCDIHCGVRGRTNESSDLGDMGGGLLLSPSIIMMWKWCGGYEENSKARPPSPSTFFIYFSLRSQHAKHDKSISVLFPIL